MRIHPWNTLLSLFFAALMALGIWWLFVNHRFFYPLPLQDLFLMSLAIFRLIRLFTYDVITKFIRDWFADAREGTFPHTLGTLLNCPWCTGLWFSFLVVFSYYATPFAWPVILILAVAGIASFLMTFSNLVGWMAEERKHEVRSKFGE
ncbi:MAG: sporulation protein [Parcubacteria group bacterium]|nr:sporulation protein [Parcubacteria group bacterium]